jgi:hypothetical protein
MAAAILPYVGTHGFPVFALGVRDFTKLFVFIPWIIAGTLAHEALHGLGWIAAGGKNLRSVRFGFHWKTFTPYAHCTEPITARAYRIGIVLPGIVVGLLPVLAGYALSNPPLILFGAMFLGGAAGDMLGLWAIRNISPEAMVLDHPSRVGCTVVPQRTEPS